MPRVTEGMFAEGAHTVDPREPLLAEARDAKNDLDDLFAGLSDETEQQKPTSGAEFLAENGIGQTNLSDQQNQDLSEVWEAEKRKQLDEAKNIEALTKQLWKEQKEEYEIMNQAHQDVVACKIVDVTDAEDKTKWEAAKEKGQEIAAKAQEAGSSAVETVQQKGREFKEATAEKFEAAKEKTQELTEKAQEKGAEIKEKVQEKAADVKETVKEGLETAKEKGAIVGEQIKEKAIEAKDFTKEKLIDAQHKVEEWKDTAFEKGAEAKEGTANVLSNMAIHVKDAALTVGHAVADTFSHVVERLKPHDKSETSDQFTENNTAVVETTVTEARPETIQTPEDPEFAAVKFDSNKTEGANLEFAEGVEERIVAEAPIMLGRDKTKSRFC